LAPPPRALQDVGSDIAAALADLESYGLADLA
jgi:hypothetical protein